MRILICLAIAMSVATVAHADDMPHLSLHYFSHDDDCPSRQRIADATAAGDFPRVVLGIVVMSALVLACNRLIWHPLYRLAERRYRLD